MEIRWTVAVIILLLEYVVLRIMYNESFRVHYISHDLNMKPFFLQKFPQPTEGTLATVFELQATNDELEKKIA